MAIFVDKTIETPRGRFSYGEAGSGPARLLLHSLLTDRTALDQIADSLGGRIIALDLPGFTEDFIAANPTIAEERTQIMRRTNPAAFITAASALRSLDYSGLASGVTVPTLIVVGEQDQATPPELAEQLQRLIRSSDLIRLPAIAHAPQLEDPDGFNKATKPFLEGQ